MTDRRSITVVVNGVSRSAEVPVRLTLADCIRHAFGLTGTHVGCEHGVCGACTILLDGVAVRSCLTLAVQANGRRVDTVEGLAPPEGPMHPLQQAFRDHHALQCGFCTPGILMTLAAYLEEKPAATEEDIRHAVSGNLCRCTGYLGIIEAAMSCLRAARADAA